MRWTVDHALEHWQKEGLISASKAHELRGSLKDEDHELPSRAIAIFSALGAVLVGLGVILFVASNWSVLSPTFKVGLLLAGFLGTAGVGYWLAYERKDYVRTGMALLFASALIYGASIFLVAQIYHLPLNYWFGMLLWFAGTAGMAYILQSRLHLWLSVPLFIVFLGWLRQRWAFGFSEFDFLFDEGGRFFSLLPALGTGLISLGILHRLRKETQFGEQTLFHWGLFLTLVTIIIGTAAQEAFFTLFDLSMDAVTVVIVVASFALALLAFALGKFRVKQGKWALLMLAGYVAFTHALGHVPVWFGWEQGNYWMFESEGGGFQALHAIHILLTFVLLMTIVWYGTLLRSAPMINLGIGGLGIAVIIQYFSWVFALLDRSLAFILGGLLILALGWLLERKRRTLLVSAHR
jgi:uncharacterized membrane protein